MVMLFDLLRALQGGAMDTVSKDEKVLCMPTTSLHLHSTTLPLLAHPIQTLFETVSLQGGAMDTVSKGETVVRVPGSAETRHLTGFTDSPGGQLPSNEELAERLRDTVVSLQLAGHKRGCLHLLPTVV
jgi:hypothetical protein